jgi:DNA polymerase-3 subunit beta
MLDFLKTCDEKIFFGLDDNICILKNKDDILRINLVSETFPDYNKVFANLGGEKEIIINKNQILETLFRIMVMCDPYNPKVKIKFTKGVAIMFSSQNLGFSGEVEDEVITNYTGEDIEMALDVKYLLNAINLVDEEKICIGIKSTSDPVFICGEKTDDYFCMIVTSTFVAK